MQQRVEPTYMQQLATFLSRRSGNLLDFHNIGGLAQTRIQESFTGLWTNYSWREYMARGGIVLATMTTAYWGGQPANSEEDFSYSTAALYGGLAFIGSHVIAVADTVSRRRAMRDRAEVRFEEICCELNNHLDGLLKLLMLDRIEQIHHFEFPVINRLDVSRNLFWKLNVMENMHASLQVIMNDSPIQEETLDWFLQEDLVNLTEHFKNSQELPQKVMNTYS